MTIGFVTYGSRHDSAYKISFHKPRTPVLWCYISLFFIILKLSLSVLKNILKTNCSIPFFFLFLDKCPLCLDFCVFAQCFLPWPLCCSRVLNCTADAETGLEGAIVLNSEALAFLAAIDQWTKVDVTWRCDLVPKESTAIHNLG